MAASEKPRAAVWHRKSVFQMYVSFPMNVLKKLAHLYSLQKLRASES